VALACLLAQAAACPEGQGDGVVLVEHLVDRLGQESGRVGRVLPNRLGHGDDPDPEALAQELLIAARLDLAASEPGGVEHEHALEASGGCVGHEALELGSGLGLAPSGVKVAVLGDEIEVVLGRELGDRLALGVGGEALALLLG
jgi:hypothetical protein